jgi:hypothetical protein
MPFLASHSINRGHFFFDRFPSQSPQMVISWLHGVNPSVSPADKLFLFLALRAFEISVTFCMFQVPGDPNAGH